MLPAKTANPAAQTAMTALCGPRCGPQPRTARARPASLLVSCCVSRHERDAEGSLTF